MLPKELTALSDMLTRLDDRLAGAIAGLEGGGSGSSLEDYVPDVASAKSRLKAGMGTNSDVVMRDLVVEGLSEPALVVYIDGIVDNEQVGEGIIGALLHTKEPPERWGTAVVWPGEASRETSWSGVLDKLASGWTLVFAPGIRFVWAFDTTKFQARPIERPQTELSVRGSEEAFNEVLATQKGQLRRRLRSPMLTFHDVAIGRVQHVKLAVAFIDGVANPGLVDVVLARTSALDVDGIVNSNMVGGLIRDHPWSAFPTIRASERVDVVSWELLQGTVAILTDGDPFVLLAPAPLVTFYRTAMDYSTSWTDASFARLIRFAGWVLALYLPALYVAFTEVNPSLVPSSLLVIITGSHAGLPFSPLAEILLMILVIEILREAAIRLPQILSTTIGTVGAIVVGTAIVRAGVVDTQIIVLMTLTALALFSTPVYELVGPWRLLSLALLLAGGVLGLLGILLVTMATLVVVMDMQSFGVPYFAPWAPFRGVEWHDAILRLPWVAFTRIRSGYRPLDTAWRTPQRVEPRPHLRRARRRADSQ